MDNVENDEANDMTTTTTLGMMDGDASTSLATTATPLQQQILQIVKSCPNYTIRPARLSQELGISVTDASAELCGLLAAVGTGSTFYFETVSSCIPPSNENDETAKSYSSNSSNNHNHKPVQTMVFTFPPDFEQRANRKQRHDDWKSALYEMGLVAGRALKILTAFGLILSLLIVSIAAMMALLAAIVALSQGGDRQGNHQNSILMRQFRHLCLTVREVLWFYALFGSPVVTNASVDDEDGRRGGSDPFLQAVAYDLWLVLSVCCGNPSSIFFWFHASQLQRRRHRAVRGWERYATNHNNNNTARHALTTSETEGWTNSGIQGVTLMQRGQPVVVVGASSSSDNNNNNNEQQQRGLLSIAAEFLFGGSNHTVTDESSFHALVLLEAKRWKLIAAVILQKSALRLSLPTTEAGDSGDGVAAISLQELSPYATTPASSLQDTFPIVAEGLRVVAHFNGVPAPILVHDIVPASTHHPAVDSTTSTITIHALFTFPELLAEGRFATRYDGIDGDSPSANYDDGSWQALLYRKGPLSYTPTPTGGRRVGGGGIGRLDSSIRSTIPPLSSSSEDGDLPRYFHEPRHSFSKLEPHQFYLCLSLGILNMIGVYWFAQSVAPGGILLEVFGIGSGMEQRGVATMGAASAAVATKGNIASGGGGGVNVAASSGGSGGILVGMLSLLISVLLFYAKLFFVIPSMRLIWIVISNHLLHQRNQRRQSLADALSSEKG
jgi:hypothetical protein